MTESLGKIINISEDQATIKLTSNNIANNLMNLHVILEDKDKRILGEVEDIGKETILVNFLGEFNERGFISGVLRKPALDSKVRIINGEEIAIIAGTPAANTLVLGYSPLYNNYPINITLNNLFDSHMCVFGNSGSGKSSGLARIMQNVFINRNTLPYNANILMFDSSGEYPMAFSKLSEVSPHFNVKVLSTNFEDNYEKVKIPLAIFNVDDFALLVNASEPTQLPILEQALKTAYLFATTDYNTNSYKNHIIAKAIMNVYYSNMTSAKIKNAIFNILETCNTPELNLNIEIPGIGYTRAFRKCFELDNKGYFAEDLLISSYISNFINMDLDNFEPTNPGLLTIENLYQGFNFTMISEGFLNDEKAHSDAITIKVRLQQIMKSNISSIFDYPTKTDVETFLKSIIVSGNKKSQIVVFNIEGIDDWLAKTIVKIYSRLVFEYSKKLTYKGSIPFHLMLEEAHRFVQNDIDTYLFGYNIFDRIAKEGRKFGVLLTLISQRLTDLSDTTISQCSNFLLFRLNHPLDLEYVGKMIPAISGEVIERLKTLQPGTCVGFGKAFKIPWVIKFEMPNPAPISHNVDIYTTWMINNPQAQTQPTTETPPVN